MDKILKRAKISFLEKENNDSHSRQPIPNPVEEQVNEADSSPALGTPSQAWNEALTCEARNSLQVVLSGMEILLEDQTGNLQLHQKTLLSKVMDNAYHLCHLISLLGPEEFKLEQMSAEEIEQIRQGAGSRFS
jgi:hypothetical protein